MTTMDTETQPLFNSQDLALPPVNANPNFKSFKRLMPSITNCKVERELRNSYTGDTDQSMIVARNVKFQE